MDHRIVGNINVAFVFGVLQFVSTFAFARCFAWYARSSLDPLAEAIRVDADRIVAERVGPADARLLPRPWHEGAPAKRVGAEPPRHQLPEPARREAVEPSRARAVEPSRSRVLEGPRNQPRDGVEAIRPPEPGQLKKEEPTGPGGPAGPAVPGVTVPTVPGSAVPDGTASTSTVPDNTVPNNAVPNQAVPNQAVPNKTAPAGVERVVRTARYPETGGR